MACRIIIFHSDGRALYGLDGFHGDSHAAAWVSEVVAAIARDHGVTPIVVEYDPIAGGADANDVVCALHELRLDVHVLPDGSRELLGIARGARHVCRALRVIQGPAEVAGDRRTIRNRGQGISELAHQWRMGNDAVYRRSHQRARRAHQDA